MKTNILNSFINYHSLDINSERYPFKNFVFDEEAIDENDFIFPLNSIIGKQAEAAFESYLNHSKKYKLLGANLQIPGEKGTLGELQNVTFSFVR